MIIPTLDPMPVSIGAFVDEGGRVTEETGEHIPGTLIEQVTLAQALGIESVFRKVNMGPPWAPQVRNLQTLSDAECDQVLEESAYLGHTWRRWGSALGKGIYADGATTAGTFLTGDGYLNLVAGPLLERAKLFRNNGHFGFVRLFFSQIPPGGRAEDWVSPAATLMRPTIMAFINEGFTVGAEIEVKQVGDSAATCMAFHKLIDNPKFGLILDFGNIETQGDNVRDAWAAMQSAVISIHGKHYLGDRPESHGPVDESGVFDYGLLTHGTSRRDDLTWFFAQLREWLPHNASRLQAAGLSSLPFDNETHAVGPGPTGGISTSLGVRLGVDASVKMLMKADVPIVIKGWAEIKGLQDQMKAAHARRASR